jgi:LysR family transcriptional activator of nhaA
MTPTVLESETSAQYGVRVVGRTDELVEEFYAVTVERRSPHPCAAAVTAQAGAQLLGS